MTAAGMLTEVDVLAVALLDDMGSGLSTPVVQAIHQAARSAAVVTLNRTMDPAQVLTDAEVLVTGLIDVALAV